MTIESSASLSKQVTFTEINLEDIKRKKLPKRLVYFSDGVLEEYSSDEEMEIDITDTQPLIDPKTLTWFPYFGYLFWMLGAKALSACDYLGENLAWFMGITSPKFQYEIDQYQKMIKEEEEVASEMKGWNSGDNLEMRSKAINQQPQPVVSDNDLNEMVSTSVKSTLSTSQVLEAC